MEVLKEYSLEELILGETGDNASVNDKTLNELETLFQEVSFTIITGHHTQIRCFAHILNLVVKVCMSALDSTMSHSLLQAILSQFEVKRRPKATATAKQPG